MARRGVNVEPQGDVLSEMNRQSGISDRLDLADSKAREAKGFVPVDEIVDPTTVDMEGGLVRALDEHRLGLKNDRARGGGKKGVTSELESGVLRRRAAELESGVLRRRAAEKTVQEDEARLREVRKSLGLEPESVPSSGKPRLTAKQLGGADETGEDHRIHGRVIERIDYERLADKQAEREKRKPGPKKRKLRKRTLRERKRDQPGREKVSPHRLQVEREEQKSGLPIHDGAIDQIPRMEDVLRSEPLGPIKSKDVFVVKKPRLTGEEIGEMFEEELDRKDNRGSRARQSQRSGDRAAFRSAVSRKEAEGGRRLGSARQPRAKGKSESGRQLPREKSGWMRRVRKFFGRPDKPEDQDGVS